MNRTARMLMVIGCSLAVCLHPAMAKDFIYTPVNNALQIIDCDTDTVVDAIPYNDYIIGSGFSPDGSLYYMNNWNSIYVVDAKTHKIIDIHKFSTELSRVTLFGFTVSEDGSKLYLSCSIVKKKQNIPKLNVLPPQLIVYDLQTKKMVKNYEVPFGVSRIVTLKNDPDTLILLALDLYQLSLKSGDVQKVMGFLNPEQGEDGKNILSFWDNGSPGDHGIFTAPYYTAEGMGYIIIDRNTGDIRKLPAKDVWFAYSTTVSPDKKYLYAVMDELIKVDMQTGETLKSVPLQNGTCYVVTLNSDGKKVYVGPGGADLSVYNSDTLELLGVIPLAGDGVQAHRISQ